MLQDTTIHYSFDSSCLTRVVCSKISTPTSQRTSVVRGEGVRETKKCIPLFKYFRCTFDLLPVCHSVPSYVVCVRACLYVFLAYIIQTHPPSESRSLGTLPISLVLLMCLNQGATSVITILCCTVIY